MNDERQSRLLADFLAALRQDVQAAPPADLDPDVATMARLLAAAKTPPPDAAVRERVWQRALAANRTPRVSANGRTAHLSDKENTMTTIARPLPRGRSTHPFTMAAALMLAAMAALLLFSRPPSGPGSGQPAILGNPEQQDATATPLATLVPSASPTLALIEHRVQAGETLDSIVQLYGYTEPTAIDRIIAMNPSVRDGSMTEGTILLIPLPAPTPLLTATPVPFSLSTASATATPLFAPSLVPVVEGAPGLPMPTLVPAFGEATITSGAVPPGAVTVVPMDPSALPPTVVPPAWMMAEPEPISLGETVTGELTPDLPQLTYRFTAEATGPVFARARSEELTALGIGFQVMRDGSGGGGGGGGSGDRATTQEISGSQYVYAGDQVTVLVNNAAPETGRFTLSVQQASATTIGYGETVTGTIDVEQPIAYYTFQGTQGDEVTVRVTGEDGFDTRLTLASTTPESIIVNDDDGGPGYDPEVQWEMLPATGEFTIQVQPVIPGGGAFTLTLERAESVSLDEGPQQVAFNSKYQPLLSFEGEAGETVQINVTAIRGSTSARYITAQVTQNGLLIADISRDFGQLSAATQPAAGAVLTSGTVTIPQDGPVNVRVHASTALDSAESLTVEVEVAAGE